MTDHRIGATSPITRFVRSLGADYFTRNEIAEALGVSVATLKTWARDADLGPTAYTNYGGTKVYLYTGSDLELLRAHAEAHWPIRANGLRTRKRGRPQLWTARERRERQSRQRRVIYLDHRAAAALMLDGHENEALRHAAAADEIRAELDEQYAKRFAQVTTPRVPA